MYDEPTARLTDEDFRSGYLTLMKRSANVSLVPVHLCGVDVASSGQGYDGMLNNSVTDEYLDTPVASSESFQDRVFGGVVLIYTKAESRHCMA